MFSVTDFLDRAKKGAGVTSDYALAKLLGHKSQANISNWRNERTAPDERAIEALCKLSGDDPEYVAAMIQGMRAANDDAAHLWQRVAARLQKGFSDVALLVVLATLFGAGEYLLATDPASPLAQAVSTSVHYVKWMVIARVALLYWRLFRRPTAPALA